MFSYNLMSFNFLIFQSWLFPFFGSSWVAMVLIVEVRKEGGVDRVNFHQVPLLSPGAVLQLPRLEEAGEGGVREGEGGGGGHHGYRWVGRVRYSLETFP